MEKLPDEILLNILLRLPISSLIRCRSVSKTWCSIIKDPYFANMHFTRAAEEGDLCCITIPTRGDKLCLLETDGSGTATVKATTRNHLFNGLSEHNSRHGLLCTWDDSRPEFAYLCNPITSECVMLPKLSEVPSENVGTRFGIGFDRRAKEYKVLRIVVNCHEHHISTICEIYMLGTNSWRNIGSSPYPLLEGLVYAKGDLHWLIYDYNAKVPLLIISLDMEDEEFHEIEIAICYADSVEFVELDVLRDCLSLILYHADDIIAIWVMKDGLWTTEATIRWLPDWGYHRPIQRNGASHLGYFITAENLTIYDPNQKKVRHIRIHRLPEDEDHYIWAHTGSLVSLQATLGGAKMVAEQKNEAREDRERASKIFVNDVKQLLDDDGHLPPFLSSIEELLSDV